MNTTTLDYFMNITSWAKPCNYSNTYYFVKFRAKKDISRIVYSNFKKIYPNLELKFYVTKKDMVLLGGQFHKDSGVFEQLANMFRMAKEYVKQQSKETVS